MPTTLTWDKGNLSPSNFEAGTTESVNQVAHGFVMPVFGVIPVYDNAGTWTAADGNASSTYQDACIVEVTDADNIVIQRKGYVEVTNHGLQPYTDYFLSEDLAGDIVFNEPTSAVKVVTPVDEDWLYIHNYNTPKAINGLNVDATTGQIKLGGDLTENTVIGDPADFTTLAMYGYLAGLYGTLVAFLNGAAVQVNGSSSVSIESAGSIRIGKSPSGETILIYPNSMATANNGDILYLYDDTTGEVRYKTIGEFLTDVFAIVDHTDNTKKVDWNVSAITTGTTRTITMPDADVNLGDIGGGDITKFINGAAIDSPTIDVSSDGATITLSLEKSGGGDINVQFSDGVYTLDCTPAQTITLTAGTDIAPQINYIYVLQSTKTLTASTSGFPAAEYMPVASVICQSAASLQTYGAYKVHAWTDHLSGSDDQGHLSHLNYWIRQQNATWTSGIALTPTGGSGTFDIATTSGDVLQLHPHDFPAFNTATGSEVYVINDFTTPYNRLGDLTGITADANGDSVSGKWYNLVVWGVVSEDSADSKIMVNVPDGVYNNNSNDQATLDSDGTAVYNIPTDYRGTGFLIARLTVSNSGSTYTIQQNQDLRGLFPSTSAGGSGGSGGGASPLTTKGDIYTYDSADARLPVGTDGQFLTADSGETTGLKWETLPTGNMACATFYDGAGGQVLTTTNTVINLDSTLTNNATGVYSLATDEVTINEDAYYNLSFLLTCDLNTGGTRENYYGFLQVDTGAGYSTVLSSFVGGYSRIAGEYSTASGSINYQLSAGDKIRIVGTSTAANGNVTVILGSRLNIIQLKGVKGDTGATGAAGGNEKEDNVFRVIDNGDNTKKIAFEASGITTATTRTITMPDADVNLGSMITLGSWTALTAGTTVSSGTAKGAVDSEDEVRLSGQYALTGLTAFDGVATLPAALRPTTNYRYINGVYYQNSSVRAYPAPCRIDTSGNVVYYGATNYGAGTFYFEQVKFQRNVP